MVYIYIVQAEQMLQRALDGYAKAIHPNNRFTFIPALDNMWAFASLRKSQGRVEDARHWHLQALLGYEKTFGQDHDKCQALRDKLDALGMEEEEEEEEEGIDPSTDRVLMQGHISLLHGVGLYHSISVRRTAGHSYVTRRPLNHLAIVWGSKKVNRIKTSQSSDSVE